MLLASIILPSRQEKMYSTWLLSMSVSPTVPESSAMIHTQKTFLHKVTNNIKKGRHNLCVEYHVTSLYEALTGVTIAVNSIYSPD